MSYDYSMILWFHCCVTLFPTGILTARWRVFTTDMTVHSVPRIRRIVKAACLLHNILRQQMIEHHIPTGFVDYEDTGARVPLGQAVRLGRWRDEVNVLGDMTGLGGTNVCNQAKLVRERFCRYLSSEVGSVSWQDSRVSRTGRKRGAEELD